MRSKSIQEVQKAAKGIPSSAFPPTFVPVTDGKVVFADYNDRADKGLFIKAVSHATQI
jgi:hypothetical protein